jgi:RNA polymerase sigma-70 factor (ECF subfamily)
MRESRRGASPLFRRIAGYDLPGGVILGREPNLSQAAKPLVSPEHLARLIDEHAAALELYAAQWAASPADVVQEAFLRLVRQTELPERVVPWLYRVVRNLAISAARSAERRRRHEMRAARGGAAWFSATEGSLLDAEVATDALRDLPDEQREVIIARLWGGLSFEQIAEVTDTSSSTAHRRYEAGLAALRERLGVTWDTKKSGTKS